MSDIAIGLIGTGFMGKCHALAFRAVSAVFPEVPTPRLELLADVDPDVTGPAAKAFGFTRWTTDWRALVHDPAIDLVAITTPNFLHQEMALAAIEAGKHVYCEKPLALGAAGARDMTSAAEAAGVKTLVGYNYLHSPATALAKEIIESGEIGEVVQFRGTHFEDYMADPDAPVTWRHPQPYRSIPRTRVHSCTLLECLHECGEPAGDRDQPLSSATRAESGRLVAMVRCSAGAGA